MSISRLVALDATRLAHRSASGGTIHPAEEFETELSTQPRKGITIRKLRAPSVRPAAPTDLPPQEEISLSSSGGGEGSETVANALEVLSRYIPSEVVAIYIFGLSILGILNEDFGDYPIWGILFGLCLLLVLLFVTISWRVVCRTEGSARFPIWPLFAALVSFVAWSIAIPGNPVTVTNASSTLAGFAALVSSYVLAAIEKLFD